MNACFIVLLSMDVLFHLRSLRIRVHVLPESECTWHEVFLSTSMSYKLREHFL